MHDGAPATPEHASIARELMADVRRQLVGLTAYGVTGLTVPVASAAAVVAQLGRQAMSVPPVRVEVREGGGVFLIMAIGADETPIASIPISLNDAAVVIEQLRAAIGRHFNPNQ